MYTFGLKSRLFEENKEGDPAAGAGTPPQFDSEAFFARISGEFNKGINALDKRLKAIEKPAETTKPHGKSAEEQAASGETGKEGKEGKGAQGQGTPEYNALELKFRELSEANRRETDELRNEVRQTKAEAEKKDRLLQVTSKLGGFKFRSETARNDAMRFFAEVAERDDNGELIANNLPLGKYIEQEMGPTGSRAYMIAPVETNGSGAGKGNSHGAGKAIDLNEIKPGMSKDDLARAMAQIAQLTSQ